MEKYENKKNIYRIWPNYRTVHLDFSRLLKNLQ